METTFSSAPFSSIYKWQFYTLFIPLADCTLDNCLFWTSSKQQPRCCRCTVGFGVFCLGHIVHLKCCTVNIHQTFMSQRCAVCLTGLTQCLALKQISVIQGDTLTLTCPLTNTNMSDAVEWRNPEGFLLFFNRDKGKNTAWATICSITN